MTFLRRLVISVLLTAVAACSGATGGTAEGATGDAVAPSGVVAPASPSARPSAAATAPATPAASAPGQPPASTPASPGAIAPSEGFRTAEVALTDGRREIVVPVWVADTPPLRQRGLMGRTSLPADAGMLFVFEEDSGGGFWMKDTRIPLSIAFADANGLIVDVLDMEPCAADPCPVYTPDATYRYALEANLGFFEDHGVTAGWTVALDGVLGAR